MKFLLSSQKRDRAVLFRLSEDEYNTLTEACQRLGGRNLSDFTRSEVLEYLNSGSSAESPLLSVATLEQEIAELKTAVSHLNHLVAMGAIAPNHEATSRRDSAAPRPRAPIINV
jgi:hypothetical protein